MATRARRLPKSDAGPRQSSRGGGRETPMMSALNKTWDGQDINGLADQSLLKDVYLEFARFGSREPLVTMDSFRFMKLCRECGLLCEELTPTDIDLVFCKVRHCLSKHQQMERSRGVDLVTLNLFVFVVQDTIYWIKVSR